MDRFQPRLDPQADDLIHAKLYAFQDAFRRAKWGDVRIINNWNLLLVEKSLALLLGREDTPAAAYRLVVDYCQNFDPRYGNSLNGPSSTKIMDLIRFMFTVEAQEELT